MIDREGDARGRSDIGRIGDSKVRALRDREREEDPVDHEQRTGHDPALRECIAEEDDDERHVLEDDRGAPADAADQTAEERARHKADRTEDEQKAENAARS